MKYITYHLPMGSIIRFIIGESVSLGIKSREREDESVIDMINSL